MPVPVGALHKRERTDPMVASASAAEGGDQILDSRRLVLEHRLFGFDGLDQVFAQPHTVGRFLGRTTIDRLLPAE